MPVLINASATAPWIPGTEGHRETNSCRYAAFTHISFLTKISSSPIIAMFVPKPPQPGCSYTRFFLRVVWSKAPGNQ